MPDTFTFSADALLNNLSNFDGKKEQDIHYFLEQFHEIAEAAKLSDQARLILLKTKIAGNAKQILINSPELRNETKYTDFTTKLAQHFRHDTSFAQAQHKFNKIKQLPTQTVDEFSKQFNLAAQKYLSNSGHSQKDGAKDFLNTIKITKFIEALRPDISFEVQKAGPDTYEDALKIAKKIEIAINNSKAEINTIKTEESPLYNALAQLSMEQTEKIKNLTEEVNTLKLNNFPSDDKKIFCHICERSNHSTKSCFYNKKNQSQNPRFLAVKGPQFSRPNFDNNNFNYIPRTRNYWQHNQVPTPTYQIPTFNTFPQNFPHHTNNPRFTSPQGLINPQNQYFDPNYTPAISYNQPQYHDQNLQTPSQPIITYPTDKRNTHARNYNDRRAKPHNKNSLN